MSIEIKDLVTNPETAPFSRLKYLARSSEEEVTKFFNGLFNLATLARETNDWTAVDGYLEQWEETLAQGLRPPIAFNHSPWAPFTKELSKARIAALSTGGIYVEGQPPFDVRGDWSYREIPLDTPLDRFRVAHTHYDTNGIAEDIDTVPLISYRFRFWCRSAGSVSSPEGNKVSPRKDNPELGPICSSCLWATTQFVYLGYISFFGGPPTSSEVIYRQGRSMDSGAWLAFGVAAVFGLESVFRIWHHIALLGDALRDIFDPKQRGR